MEIWKHDNNDFIYFIKFPVEKPICSKCVNDTTPKISINIFEQTAKKRVDMPYLYLPDEVNANSP